MQCVCYVWALAHQYLATQQEKWVNLFSGHLSSTSTFAERDEEGVLVVHTNNPAQGQRNAGL
jgi:hypothetical protein